MSYCIDNIWLLLFVFWGLPLGYYRSNFRKIVYQTNHWSINIKPVFRKEIKGLFGNLYPNNLEYKKYRKFYLFYLLVYLLLFTIYICIDSNSTTMKKLEIGDTLPTFELKNQQNILFSIDSFLGKKNLVIYFYPKDDSPGCTKQACSFRDQFEVFADADAEIIGISAQSVESHRKFAEKYHLTYTLLSDSDNQVRKLFGIPDSFFGLIPGRVTYLINKEGKVMFIFNSQLNAEKHVKEALRILQQYHD